MSRNLLLLLALTTLARCRRKHRQEISDQSAPPPDCTRVSASERLDQIHLRYWKAEPSSNFSENGVLAHQIDWISSRQRDEWDRAESGGDSLGDRMSASLFNLRWHHIYNWRLPGWIVAPAAAQQIVSCVYGADGASISRTCDPPGKGDGCLPGPLQEQFR